MFGISPYFHFHGTAKQALEFYADVFGGTPQLFTYAEFGRSDGPGDAIAHGELVAGPIKINAADAADDQQSFTSAGLMFALLGTADPATLTRWFDALAEGGEILDPLQERAWNASDGQVRDRFGVHWLIGFEHAATDDA